MRREGRRLQLSTGLDELIAMARSMGFDPSRDLDFGAIGFLLHDGQIPFPRTAFRSIRSLGVGDRIELRWSRDGVTERFAVDFPYLDARSSETEAPDARRLLVLLERATARALEGYTAPLIMLSSGKDSVALALATSRVRPDTRALTYAIEGDEQSGLARSIATKLGLPHDVVRLDQLPARDVEESLVAFFRRCPEPPGDLAQIPYVIALAAAGRDTDAVIDGTGNDTVFGYVAGSKDALATRYALGRWRFADALLRFVPPGSFLNFALRSPIENGWAGRRLRYRETKATFPGIHETSPVWRREWRRTRGSSEVDRRALFRGRHFEFGSQKQKADLAARARGIAAVYPYLDEDVIRYTFNLPQAQRYSVSTRTNKILLRRMLATFLDYDADRVGKHPFRFDEHRFVARHQAFIEAELRECEWIRREGVDLALDLLRKTAAGKRHWHPIVGLFQLVGWLNHANVLAAPPPGQTAPR